MKKSKSEKVVRNMRLYQNNILPSLQKNEALKKIHNEYTRLNFPRKDDSRLVQGVGRKHFLTNNSDNMQQLIYINSNPQMYDKKYYSAVSA